MIVALQQRNSINDEAFLSTWPRERGRGGLLADGPDPVLRGQRPSAWRSWRNRNNSAARQSNGGVQITYGALFLRHHSHRRAQGQHQQRHIAGTSVGGAPGPTTLLLGLTEPAASARQTSVGDKTTPGAPTNWVGPRSEIMSNHDHRGLSPAPSSPPDKPSLLTRLSGVATVRPATLRRSPARSARRAISLCHALMSERGEISGARLARDAVAAYQSLEAAACEVFFHLLVMEFSPDPEAVGRCADAYRDDPSQTNLIPPQQAAAPPRQDP